MSQLLMMDYLAQFATGIFSYAYVRVIYSALRFMIANNYPDVPLSQQLFVTFLRGLKANCKLMVRPTWTWDPLSVVNYVANKDYPNRLAEMAEETAAILSLSTGLRAADLHNLGRKIEDRGNQRYVNTRDRQPLLRLQRKSASNSQSIVRIGRPPPAAS